MARKPRIEFPGAFYHIITRGNRQQDIFEDHFDRKEYIDRLKKYQEKYQSILYAYVLMNNHTHLLMETGPVSLSKIMQTFQSSYTQYYNSRHKKIGHLFQGRYKAILCDKDSYLLELVRYIHLNPVRAKLVTDPKEYEWSSHRIYLGLEKNTLIDINLVLAIFGKKIGKARKRYESFILEKADMGQRKDFYKTTDQCILGDDKFIEEIKKRTSHELGKETKKIHLTMSELIDRVATQMDVSDRDIPSSSKRRSASEARSIVAFLGKEYCGYKGKEIADYLGVDQSTVANSIRRIELKMRENSGYQKQIERILEVDSQK